VRRDKRDKRDDLDEGSGFDRAAHDDGKRDDVDDIRELLRWTSCVG
jgi:hypothetical protein